MNFHIILATVHLLGEFWYTITAADKIIAHNSGLYFELADDSPKKLEQIKSAHQEILSQVLYRYSKQEPARTLARERKERFKSYSKTEYTKFKPLSKDKTTMTLWKRAKKADDKYSQIDYRFESEAFCQPKLYDKICARAFQNSYFKDEELTYDNSNSVVGDKDKCTLAIYLLNEGEKNVFYTMDFKSCSARKKNDDGTESVVKVYLQSGYKQPLIGTWKYFVLFKYIQNPSNGQWERLTDTTDGTEGEYAYRYEAYLSLDWF